MARDRYQLFFRIWKSLGRPVQGAAHDCYKEARRTYRRTCWMAINNGVRRSHQSLSDLLRANRPGQFWNAVRRLRGRFTDTDAISISSLHSHFKGKFASTHGDTVTAEQERTQERFEEVRHLPLDNLFVSERRIIHLIKQLRTSCSPGVDGITAEHIKHAISTSLPLHLSALFTLCLRFCCLPQGLLSQLD